MSDKKGKDHKPFSSSTTHSKTTEWWKKGYYYSSRDDDDDYKSRYSSYGGYSYGGGYYGGGYSSYYGSGYSGGGFYDRYSSLGYSSTSSKLSASVSGAKFSNLTELMSKAYKETRDMVVILDFPYNVKVTFSSRDGVLGSTLDANSKYIFLDTTVLDEKDYEDGDKVNIICGSGVHEACHLKYSSKVVADEFISRLSKISKDLTDEAAEIRASNSGFVKTIFNLIEDMRVENELLTERPGYSDLLSNAKDFGFDKYKKSLNATTFSDKNAKEFLDNLIRLIRYPDEIEEEVISKYSEIYTDIKNVLSPLPSSTKDSAKISISIFNIVTKFFSDLRKTGPEEKEASDGKTKSDPTGIIDSMLSSFADLINKSCSSSIFSSSDLSVDTTFKIPDEMKSKMSSSVVDETLSGIVVGDIDVGLDKGTYFHKEEGNEAIYKKCLARVNKYVPAVRKLIKGHDKNYDFNIYGCRSGLLDTTKLAEAYQGVPQVYVRKGEVRTNRLAVGVLVDESGSMGSSSWGDDDSGFRSKSSLARDAAILLNEAIKPLAGVDLFIYGHSADITYSGSTELYIYREAKKYSPKYSLASVTGRCENRDGNAIREVAHRIRKYSSEPGILFVISDGSPCAHGYWGSSAAKDVRKKVGEAEKLGFTVIQISIDYVRDVKSMFDNYIDLTSEVSKLPIELSKVVKKAIVDNKKTTIK